ncbi:MAG: glycerol-3-phosphate 1-O-acyltransferase PlsY [Ruminococcaceae bacterium]|nr:glycerol-3-phosphate 1-O-acyltransferase PlsY [Oscillospiraceae bacterium]
MALGVLLSFIFAYLLGSINTSVIIGKLKGIDIRKKGSGNAGMTNTLRVVGKRAAALVLLFDFLKTIAALILAIYISKIFVPENKDASQYMQYIAGFGAVLGHNFPIYFGFRGGKGIVCSIAVILFLDWRIGVIIATVCIFIMIITKYVSLGSVVGAIIYPIFVIAFNPDFSQMTVRFYIAMSVVISLLALYRHRANISRLLKGTESKLGQKKD